MEYKIIQAQPKDENTTYYSSPPEESTILFMTANPKNTQALNINKEFNAVQEELDSAEKDFRLRLRLDVDRADLIKIFLKEKPSILHFSGHGLGDKGLVFQNKKGTAEIVATNVLTALIDEFSEALQCIILNACYSEEQAKAFAKHVPFVIGIDNAIGDTKAHAFSKAFYTCLFLGEGYESAFRKAVLQVGLDNLAKGAQPVLYRWDPANIIIEDEEEGFEEEIEDEETNDGIPEGYKELIPIIAPDLNIFIPEAHEILKNDVDSFESEDDFTSLEIKAVEQKASAILVLDDLINALDVAETIEEPQEETFNDLEVSYSLIELEDSEDYYHYAIGVRLPNGDCFEIMLGGDTDSKEVDETLNEIFYSMDFMD